MQGKIILYISISLFISLNCIGQNNLGAVTIARHIPTEMEQDSINALKDSILARHLKNTHWFSKDSNGIITFLEFKGDKFTEYYGNDNKATWNDSKHVYEPKLPTNSNIHATYSIGLRRYTEGITYMQCDTDRGNYDNWLIRCNEVLFGQAKINGDTLKIFNYQHTNTGVKTNTTYFYKLPEWAGGK
jgi:hypothetical protein